MSRLGPQPRFVPPRLMGLLLQVEESLEHPWSHREMAERAGFSTSRFYEVFLDAVGEPPMQYLERLRLERAAIHLAHSSWRILEIALLAGFESHAGFTHAFTARYGMSPSVFRGRHGVRGPLFGASRKSSPVAGGVVPGMPDLGVPEVVPFPGFRIAFVRQWGYEPRSHPAAWALLARWVRARGLDPARSRLVGCHYDDARFTPADRWRYDAGIEVPPGFDPQGEMAVRDVPGGLVACRSYEGPPEGLRDAWQSFTDSWLPWSGYLPRTLFAFDLLPGGLLGGEMDPDLRDLPPRIPSTLCIPVTPAGNPPPAAWTSGPLDSQDDEE